MNETLTAQAQPALLERPPIVRPEVTDELMADIAARIVAEFHPYRIILFGSYAYGTPHAESDVDLLVVMEKPVGSNRNMPEVNAAARIDHLSMDILTYSPAELETRLAMGDFFVKNILARGKILYDCGAEWPQQQITLTKTYFDEWVELGESNYTTALRLKGSKTKDYFDGVCFYSQITAENYLKAFLVQHGLLPPTNDLIALLDECVKFDDALAPLRPNATEINRYEEILYPGYNATIEDAQAAGEAVKKIRKSIRKSLCL